MNLRHTHLLRLALLAWVAVAAALNAPLARANPFGGLPPETTPPLGVIQAGKPLVMLTVGRDHTLFYEAYNDASDIDGNGLLDIRFNPSITYLGLFDSTLCYRYNPGVGSASDLPTTVSTAHRESRRNDNAGLFQPVAAAGNLGVCSGADDWSGNWLNYVSTSRIDALRVVFYGGMREVDSATQTILRRSYIPQDGHSWAKEYTSIAVDGYDIQNYTPLPLPSGTGVRRHFFGNLTDVRGRNCATLADCSGRAPLLRVVMNAQNARVWQWASTERPVLHESSNLFSGSRLDYTVRAEVCTSGFNRGCKRYPQGNFKPVGLLHDFGENDSMHFGLLTGSYNRNMSGGVLRKVVSSFRDEVDPQTGVFTAHARIVNTLNAFRIRGFNDGTIDNAYRGGWVTTRPMNEREFVDWGNPVAEMMYETMRYLAGAGTATPQFSGVPAGGGVPLSGVNIDAQLGLSEVPWDNPFAATSAARAAWCARPNMLVVSGVNPSFDSDQLPGSFFASFGGSLLNLHVATMGQTIADFEPGIRGLRFIGQSGTHFDGAPTAKTVTSLGNIRGLSPEEPTKQGSYYAASVAHFAKVNDLQPALQGGQTVDTFAVALSSPLPSIVVPVAANRSISLVPFAKSVGGAGIGPAKTQFQPTNTIVDFYVDTIANSCAAAAGATATVCQDFDATVNGGRYFARFRINFEDVEQGADHDMDAIVVYEIALQSDGQLRVRLTPEYQAGGIQHSMGYVLSGSTADGVYLVTQDEHPDRPYYLNVPPGRSPGFCDQTTIPVECGRLPSIGARTVGGQTIPGFSERFFTAGAGAAAGFLADPLWYAAKWGGFIDQNNNNRPDLRSEWDLNLDGTPDTYFLVQNPVKLRESLARAFTSIFERSSAAGNIAANSTSITTDSAVFQSVFNSGNWSGDLLSYAVTPTGVASTPTWRASSSLPAWESRRIFTSSATATIPFTEAALAPEIRAQLGSTSAAQNRLLRYLRGERVHEIRHGGELRNRSETNVLGDIVHSSPVFVSDSNTVFVGSNGGKLHAFDVATGVERFAFIPAPMIPHLHLLTHPEYQNLHRYFVDGEIAVSNRAQTANANLLVGFYGRGHKGLFALDVTNPGSFGNTGDTSRFLWSRDDATFNGGPAVDPDMGYLLGRPLIARVKSDNAAGFVDVVIFGNGYGSTSGRAVVYVVDLRTGALIRKLLAPAGSVGMASPGLRLDANGLVDFIYAGDYTGRVWKFDLTSPVSSNWGSSFMAGADPVAFFHALRDGVNQPITGPIHVARNTNSADPNRGKWFVYFGTGSYIAGGDPRNLAVQTMYGLIDEDVAIAGRGQLIERFTDGIGTLAGRTVRTFAPAVSGDMVGRRGWFIDLLRPGTPRVAEGERVVSAARIISTVRPMLMFSSIIPIDDPCVPGGRGFVNAVNPFTGASLFESSDTLGIFDISGDGTFADDRLGAAFIGSFDLNVGLPSEAVLVGGFLIVGGSQAQLGQVRVPPPALSGQIRGRISWREVVR